MRQDACAARGDRHLDPWGWRAGRSTRWHRPSATFWTATARRRSLSISARISPRRPSPRSSPRCARANPPRTAPGVQARRPRSRRHRPDARGGAHPACRASTSLPRPRLVGATAHRGRRAAGPRHLHQAGGTAPGRPSTRTSCSRARPGVLAAGEMLDWEAPTGGYLLQASFAFGQGRGAWCAGPSSAATRPRRGSADSCGRARGHRLEHPDPRHPEVPRSGLEAISSPPAVFRLSILRGPLRSHLRMTWSF